ncbi:hypothetical protein B0H14DRAFT_2579756 [Mycena olivaceomarginata]|nr:hypothetical protein B0H14DRAFT_2579756 [Mycena olivaceomarginata]
MHKGLTLCGGWKRTLSQTRSKLASEWKGTLSKSIALAAPQFFASGTPGGLNIPDQHFCKGGKEHRLRLASWMVQSHQVSKSASEWKGTPSIFIASAAPQFISSRTPGDETHEILPKLAGGGKGTLSICIVRTQYIHQYARVECNEMVIVGEIVQPPINIDIDFVPLPANHRTCQSRGNKRVTMEQKRNGSPPAKHYRKKAQKREKKSKSRKRKGKNKPQGHRGRHKNEALCDSDTSEETAQIDSTLAQAERAAATLAEAEQDASEALSEMWRRVQPGGANQVQYLASQHEEEAPGWQYYCARLIPRLVMSATGMLRDMEGGSDSEEEGEAGVQSISEGGRLLRSRVSDFQRQWVNFTWQFKQCRVGTPASPRTGFPSVQVKVQTELERAQVRATTTGASIYLLPGNHYYASRTADAQMRRMVIQRKGEFRPGMACSFPKDAGPRTHDDPTLGSDLKEFRTLRMRFPTPSASSTPSPEPQSPMPSFSDYLDAYLRRRRHEGSR